MIRLVKKLVAACVAALVTLMILSGVAPSVSITAPIGVFLYTMLTAYNPGE